MAKDRDAYECSHHCFHQAFDCLRLARLRFSPGHRAVFVRMAKHWKDHAKRCGGRRDLWQSWCYRTEPAE